MFPRNLRASIALGKVALLERAFSLPCPLFSSSCTSTQDVCPLRLQRACAHLFLPLLSPFTRTDAAFRNRQPLGHSNQLRPGTRKHQRAHPPLSQLQWSVLLSALGTPTLANHLRRAGTTWLSDEQYAPLSSAYCDLVALVHVAFIVAVGADDGPALSLHLLPANIQPADIAPESIEWRLLWSQMAVNLVLHLLDGTFAPSSCNISELTPSPFAQWQSPALSDFRLSDPFSRNFPSTVPRSTIFLLTTR